MNYYVSAGFSTSTPCCDRRTYCSVGFSRRGEQGRGLPPYNSLLRHHGPRHRLRGPAGPRNPLALRTILCDIFNNMVGHGRLGRRPCRAHRPAPPRARAAARYSGARRFPVAPTPGRNRSRRRHPYSETLPSPRSSGGPNSAWHHPHQLQPLPGHSGAAVPPSHFLAILAILAI